MKVDIPLPSIAEQQAVVFKAATYAAIEQLKDNLHAPRLPGQTELDENQHSRTHLLREYEGWEPPSPDLIGAYFRHFQKHFPDYGTPQTGECVTTSREAGKCRMASGENS
jgi:hypothetical protein